MLTTFIVQKSKNLDFVVKSVSSFFMCSDFQNMSPAEVGILSKNVFMDCTKAFHLPVYNNA